MAANLAYFDARAAARSARLPTRRACTGAAAQQRPLPQGEASMNSRWRHLRVLRTLYALASLILAGCATLQTTPQQDYTYEMGRNCETPTTKIERVDPDGRYWILARGVGASTSSEY